VKEIPGFLTGDFFACLSHSSITFFDARDAALFSLALAHQYLQSTLLIYPAWHAELGRPDASFWWECYKAVFEEALSVSTQRSLTSSASDRGKVAAITTRLTQSGSNGQNSTTICSSMESSHKDAPLTPVRSRSAAIW
jgi:hypothetical protein